MRIITAIRARIQDVRENKAYRDASHAEMTTRARGYIVNHAEPAGVVNR